MAGYALLADRWDRPWHPTPSGRRVDGGSTSRHRKTGSALHLAGRPLHPGTGGGPTRGGTRGSAARGSASARRLRVSRDDGIQVTSTLPDLAPDLSAVLDKHADRLDLDLIDRALRFSASAHRGQKRMSGEDFVSHSIAVALIL